MYSIIVIVSGRGGLCIKTLVDNAHGRSLAGGLTTLEVLTWAPIRQTTNLVAALLWQDAAQQIAGTVHCLHALGIQLLWYLFCSVAALSILLVVRFVRSVLVVDLPYTNHLSFHVRYAFNVFPAIPVTSTVLHVAHWIRLVGCVSRPPRDIILAPTDNEQSRVDSNKTKRQ